MLAINIGVLKRRTREVVTTRLDRITSQETINRKTLQIALDINSIALKIDNKELIESESELALRLLEVEPDDREDI